MGVVIDASSRFADRERRHLESITRSELDWWLDEASDLIATETGVQTSNWHILNPDDD